MDNLDPPTQLYGISAAARLVGVSESTLRRYADSGVVALQRDSAGRRLFPFSEIQRLRQYRASKVGTR